MTIANLLSSHLGAIILHNTHALVQSDLLSDDDKRLVVVGLRRASRRLTLPHRPEDLIAAIRLELDPVVERLQVAGLSYPDPDVHLVAIRGWGDVRDMLEELYKAKKPDKVLQGLIYSAVHSDEFYMRAAHVLNARVSTPVPVVLSGPRNIFYLTSSQRLEKAAPGYRNLPLDLRAHKIRDVLGLGHLAARGDGRPYPLFAFRGMAPARKLQQGARIARPTTVDGFDNNRFKQEWAAADLDPCGGGMTVRLDTPFMAGSSEFVSTKILMRGHFVCEYLGSVTRPAAGSDAEFVKYLDAHHGGTLSAIPYLLETWRP